MSVNIAMIGVGAISGIYLQNITGLFREINRLGMKLVKPGGFLVSCSCSENLTPELFEKVISGTMYRFSCPYAG